jgi:hypothetical protein
MYAESRVQRRSRETSAIVRRAAREDRSIDVSALLDSLLMERDAGYAVAANGGLNHSNRASEVRCSQRQYGPSADVTMSYDLMVFDPQAPPSDRNGFIRYKIGT